MSNIILATTNVKSLTAYIMMPSNSAYRWVHVQHHVLTEHPMSRHSTTCLFFHLVNANHATFCVHLCMNPPNSSDSCTLTSPFAYIHRPLHRKTAPSTTTKLVIPFVARLWCHVRVLYLNLKPYNKSIYAWQCLWRPLSEKSSQQLVFDIQKLSLFRTKPPTFTHEKACTILVMPLTVAQHQQGLTNNQDVRSVLWTLN
jgi:hypothetical protein